MNTKYLILFSLICIFLLCFYFCFKKESPIVYTFNNNNTSNNGLTLLIISGVHGNERAGPYSLTKLLNENFFSNTHYKKIIVIPIVNTFGYRHNIRYQNSLFNNDINRNFYHNTTDYLANIVIKYVKEADIILDFHEGWGYYLNNNGSIGSTITTNKTSIITKNIINNLNNDITENNKKFTLLTDVCNIKNTLSCFINKNYPEKLAILIETTGQNNIQPMMTRFNQIQIILNSILNI